MNKEIVIPAEISIKDKKKTSKWEVIRAAVFARSKVIQAKTSEHESYYLIFYRNSLIYGDRLENVSEGSFIDKAFHEGIVVESSHPILTALIPKQPVSIPNRNKLFSQLQLHYSLQEVAYIASTLDSFFDKDQLIKVIDKIFFHNKRNGNYFKSFQVIQILADFAPEFKSANERLNSHEFRSYHDFYYSSNLPSIQKKDPLFVELFCFKKRFDIQARPILEDNLKEKNDFVELVLLWMEKVEKFQAVEQVEEYTSIALKFVSMSEWILILEHININPFQKLPEAKLLIEKMIQEGKDETAASYLFRFMDDLPDTYEHILKKLWENLDANFIVSNLDHFISFLQQQVKRENQKQVEMKIFQLIVRMLEVYDLKKVHEKIFPVQQILPQSEVIRKVNTMVEIMEDPNRMMELGDYYAEFQQYDPAIDCYFWEMELRPQDPDPVRKICKMYQQKGMVKEAAAYQKILVQLKSNQE